MAVKQIVYRWLVIASLSLGFAPAWALATTLDNARIWPQSDKVRLVLDLSGPVSHKVFSLQSPDRIVLDIQDIKRVRDLDLIDLSNTPIKRIRSAVRNGDDLRVVLDLSGKLKPRTFLLPPDGEFGHRLVIDLLGATKAVSKTDTKPIVTSEPFGQREIVIALDAGHGGKDPGAIGPRKVREKDVVLDITRALQARISQERGFNAKLTRSGDYYISLRRRTELARESNADLMVSIHADAFRSPKAYGASVFALSNRGATSETARWLAQRENNSDLIGGLGGVSLDDKPEVVASVLLDLSMTASIQSSLRVGREVLNSMGGIAPLHKKRVEQAGFVVLKSPDIPSILVETGFISNPNEAQRLGKKNFQQKMANAIFIGIRKHFEQSPPPGTWLAAKQQSQPLFQTYEIGRGDTLSGIAQRHGVNIARLRALNGLQSDRIRIGQKLRIPAS